MTHQYELMVILDPEIDERTVAPSLDKFLNVIRADGGTVDNVDIWGRRRLAYEINKKTEGIYAVVQLTANSSATVELDRQLKLSEAVMRTKVLRAEEGIAQVAAAKILSDAKAARKAAAAPAKSPAAAAPAAEPKAPESKPAESKPAVSKPAEAAPADVKADDAKAADAKATDANGTEANGTVSKPADAKPAAAKPAAKTDVEAPAATKDSE